MWYFNFSKMWEYFLHASSVGIHSSSTESQSVITLTCFHQMSSDCLLGSLIWSFQMCPWKIAKSANEDKVELRSETTSGFPPPPTPSDRNQTLTTINAVSLEQPWEEQLPFTRDLKTDTDVHVWCDDAGGGFNCQRCKPSEAADSSPWFHASSAPMISVQERHLVVTVDNLR